MSLKAASLIIFGFVIAVFIGYGAYVLWSTWPVSTTTIEKAGVFGDSFGVITSLFSGLAFAGLIVTILLQRQELTESREIFKKQKFDDAFFRLLDFYQRNLNAIVITDHESNCGEKHQGIGALNFLLKKLVSSMRPYNEYLKEDKSKKIYEYYLFVEIQKILIRQSRYLGTLESILSLIDEELESDEERDIYWRILVSQLTVIELKYIFYRCLVAPEGSKLRQLAHKSKMMEYRFSETNISKTHALIYEKIHGIAFKREKSTPVLPYTRKEIRNIRKQHRKRLKENEHNNAIHPTASVAAAPSASGDG